MQKPHNLFGSLQEFDLGNGSNGRFYSLPALEKAGIGEISKLPISLRIILESILRNFDGRRIDEENIRSISSWEPNGKRKAEVPFVVSRIVLQDFTGVPLLVDLAAMRSATKELSIDPKRIEPKVPVDLVIDHSLQVDFSGTSDAMERNLKREFERNRERYQFLKWGMNAFQTFRVIPPGIGIVHQVNLEYLAKGVLEKDGIFFPDTLVGTDSHTTMINGLGIVGWGVGGIEAEAGMLGEPVYFLTPDVVGVHLRGTLKEGVSATDLALTLTEMLRRANVVGKFVEFHGEGAGALPAVDRATIANMAPEYGATMGFFPIDEKTIHYLRSTGRTEAHCKVYENYYRAQGLWGMPDKSLKYSEELELDLCSVCPSVSGPSRPQDRINLPDLASSFRESLTRSISEGGFGKSEKDENEIEPKNIPVNMINASSSNSNSSSSNSSSSNSANSDSSNSDSSDSANSDSSDSDSLINDSDSDSNSISLRDGSVLIAALTSCTNTSNPSVMLAAGLLAKKAVERGLKLSKGVKASLAPGSRVVSDYLEKAGLQTYLDQLGFNLVGYGCTTCIGNSGPLPQQIEEAIVKNNLVAASVLSGNRNFEARIHQNVKANFLMSPPLVVAFALAGRVDLDLTKEALGIGKDGKPVFLKDLWPSPNELQSKLEEAIKPETFRFLYSNFSDQNPKWNDIPSSSGDVYDWDETSTYIQKPPFFDDFKLEIEEIETIEGARALGIFGNSVTTDHISPAGAIQQSSSAGAFLESSGVAFSDFNSYGSRRGNDRIMTRGTFANVRIRNKMLPGTEGGVTRFHDGKVMSIFEAACKYRATNTPLLIFAGQEYGTGSSRDWAAKGTLLLGVRAVIAESFERIHRSNLVGMGVLPLQFCKGGASFWNIEGSETYDIVGLSDQLRPRQKLILRVHREGENAIDIPVKCRIDTEIEIDYYRHKGILPYVLRRLIARD